MIENIRKYKGLIIFGLALVVFALVVGIKDDIFQSRSGGRDLFKINGRTYSDTDYTSLGSGSLELTQALLQSGDYGLYPFLTNLIGKAESRDAAAENFFTRRIVLRDAAKQYGIYPSEEQITKRIETYRAFNGPDNAFNPEAYNRFLKNYLGSLSLNERDLRELAADMLSFDALSNIIGSGLNYQREATVRSSAFEEQEISGSLARIDVGPIREKIQPTDEEIKTFWETTQEAYMTPVTRKFSYFIAAPTLPEKPVLEEKPEFSAAPDATQEAKDQAAKAKADAQAKLDAEYAETVKKAQEEIDIQVDDFANAIIESKGAGFEELVKKQGWEIKQTELFSAADAPNELNLPLRQSSRGGTTIDELFKMQLTSDPLSAISQSIACGTNEWLVAKLVEEQQPRRKTFDEAKDEAREKLIAERAGDELKKTAEAARAKIQESLASGKSFADAAKDAGIADVTTFSKISSSTPSDATRQPKDLFLATRALNEGELAEVDVETDRAFIIQVDKREIVRSPDANAQVDATMTRNTNNLKQATLMQWFDEQAASSDIRRLF